ncbi:winged helix-turn-helix domain-containing protein [Rhizobium johnstonii]|uniref:winged helix-turn-helix domain-containing protein n=1 Tax=Rhizobium johnstonii TaxID=3019933 RepID=UPI003F976DB9
MSALKALGPSKPKAVYDWIRRNEPVPVADLTGSTSDGENLLEKNVRWARFQLRQDGVVSSPARGVWDLA